MPTLAQVQSLYAATRAGASRFASYNFHAYFLRRTDESFAPALATLGDTTTIPASVGARKLSEADLAKWYDAAKAAAPVVERAGEINALYATGDKLVVENTDSRHGKA
ncbi:LYR motif-containing protein 4 [Vanrija pseudolonga]|uniref:LYR motif-containing protein 4 n=1 Tax=Vanrija pseudolonga TaxID=143232 RepID=A0AAF1BI91_9TREE|nr:LYR motif-containing protein 4 [Vanrija pseudolonga]